MLEPVETGECLDLVKDFKEVSNTKGKAIIGNEGILIVLLEDLVLTTLNMFNEVECQRWNHDVEKLEVRAFSTVKYTFKVLDENS